MSNYISRKPDQDGHVNYPDDENEIWQILITRQKKIIPQYACDEFIEGMEKLNFSENRIPQCPEITEVLQRETGWAVEPVAALIPVDQFFHLIANRKFPVATFIRRREDLDYLKEPDVFHEFFGHCPLLTNQTYADYVQWYGQHALKGDETTHRFMGRLFWFTVEFGLLKHRDQFKIFGGGILSSFEETIYAASDEKPKRLPFDLDTVLKTDYRYDHLQPIYYYLNSIDELFNLTKVDLIARVKKILDSNLV